MTRFLDKHLDKWEPEPNSGCYLWTGAVRKQIGHRTNQKERPCVLYDSKNSYAARASLESYKGAAPSKKHQAAHKCHNPMCVNPEHLVWATQSENLLMENRGAD